MKKILFVLFIALAVASCKSHSTIVTSKSEAKKRGLYTKVASTQNKNTKKIPTKSISVEAIYEANNSYTKSDYSEIVTPEYETAKTNVTNTNDSAFTMDLISEAKNYLGVRYKNGGTTRAGMDCSGLVHTVFKEFDYKLPRTSRDMAKVGVPITKKNIAPGDLVFFKTNGRSVINHVGIVVDVHGDEFKFIHSSTSRGVIISSNTEAYYKKTFAQANRVL